MRGLTTPNRVGCELLSFCVGTRDFCVVSYWIDTLVLKNRGKYLHYFAASSSPLRGKPKQAQDVARRISGAVAGESTQKVNIPSTHHNPISRITLFAICLLFSSPPPPNSPLLFYSPSLSILPLCLPLLSACFLFARVLDCLFVAMAQDTTKLCDFTNTNNNDFLSTPIAPLTDTESCEINAAL